MLLASVEHGMPGIVMILLMATLVGVVARGLLVESMFNREQDED